MILRKFFKESGVVKLVGIMSVILLVLVGTMILSAGIANKELQKQSFKQYETDASFLKSVSNMMTLSSVWTIGSFIEDYVDVSYLVADSISLHYLSFADPEKLCSLSANTVYERMESFLDYNVEYSNTCFIFEPSVLKSTPEGLCAVRIMGDSTRYDLPELRETDIYKKVSASRYPLVLHGTLFGKPELFFCVPILDKEEKVVSQFWSGYDIGTFFSWVENYQAEGDDYDFVITDSEGNVIYHHDYDVYGRNVSELLPLVYNNYPKDFSSKLLASLRNNEITDFETEYSGHKLFTCVFPILFTDFHLIKVYRESTILKKSKQTIRMVALFSIVGLLLILSLLTFLFIRFYNNQKERNRIESELGVAEHIQRSILPVNGEKLLPSSLEVYGFQKSALVIGGDLFDYTVRDGKLYFAIGDVSGDGVPAALMMTQICSLLRHISKTETSPSAILSVLNESALDDDENRMFCTMFAGVLDSSDGSLRFCNAGHCRPVIIRNGSVKMLSMKANMPVYAFDSYTYSDEVVSLEPGDSLLLYTDGVTEARNSSREFFGSERLLSVLSSLDYNTPSLVVNAVREAVDSFCCPMEQYDDMTMLCIKFKNYENKTL